MMPHAPYQHPLFRVVAGRAWRPGGVALTAHALESLRGRGAASGARILDVGCGAGGTLELLRQSGFWAVGVDRDLTVASSTSFDFLLCADACHLPLADGVFDAVISECVLSLLPKPEAALDQWARVLCPGGTLLLADIFARSDAEIKVQRGAAGCLAGAVPAATTKARLHAAGFAVRQWEDHSLALRELAAQLIWNGAVLEDFAHWLNPNRTTGCAAAAGAQYGYALWVADKE